MVNKGIKPLLKRGSKGLFSDCVLTILVSKHLFFAGFGGPGGFGRLIGKILPVFIDVRLDGTEI